MNLMIKDLISLSYTSRLDEDSGTIPYVLNYSIQSFTNTELILKCNFSDPLFVSSNLLRDHIDLVFLENKIFQAKSDGYMLESNFTILGIEIPP